MGSDVAVQVLGPVRLTAGGSTAELMPALRTLLAALVVDAPRVVSADGLLTRLWEDETGEGSMATLHSYVSRLRRRLGPDVLVTQAPGYRLDLPAAAVDAERFTALLRAAREEPDAALARTLIAEAVALWDGDAFADVPQRFARVAATRLAEQHLEALELGADLDLRLGRHHQVVDDLTPLVEREPLREGLRAALMVALYRCGRQAAALEVYEQGRHLLADELGVDPGPALRRLHEQVLRQDASLDAPEAPAPGPAVSPATRPATRPPATAATLVEPPTSLVGREQHLDDLVAAVDGGSRLLTLTGAGGVGKTRLALAAAGRLRQRFEDGVVLVPLATLRDPQLVLPTVAHTLGRVLPAAGGEETSEARDEVAGMVGERRVLLVLDNAEHLLDVAPDVSWLVASCPRLVVLVTSRAPLRVAGEEERLVEPLALPAPGRGGAPLTAQEAEVSPAVSLFVTRARSVARGFVLDEHNADDVVEICRRLGGIPLALELAAARIRLLEPRALLERLDEALASGPRDLPERQRTMQATLDWSYRLLDAPAQELFRRLSVFSGGWSLELFLDVVGPGAVASLEDLVEHSLVGVSWSVEGRPRYAMLEPVRQHSRRLAAPAEHDETAAAHARACLALAERAARGYLAAEQVHWLEVVDAEHANLLAAHEHGVVSGDHDAAGRIAWALWLYWWFRGYAVLGRRTATAAAALPGAAPRTRTRATIAAAAMAFAQGDHRAAGELWLASRDEAAAAGDVEAEAHSVAGLGIVALSTGDVATAEQHQRRAIASAQTLGPDTDGPWILAINHVWLGTALLEAGRRDEALGHFRTGHGLAVERGDRLGAFVALWNLARAEAGHDDAAAHAHLREGIRLSHEVGDLSNLSFFLDALVVVEVRRGVDGPEELARLATLLGAAQACRDLGNAEAYGYYLPDDAARDAATATLRERLGADAHAEQLRSGRVLRVDAAVDLALR